MQSNLKLEFNCCNYKKVYPKQSNTSDSYNERFKHIDSIDLKL